jgi:lysophospholipase L1-like esterase
MVNSKKLVFLGDSLTQWGNWGQRFAGYQVTNLGIAGETVEGLLARLERIHTRINDPDFIFLMTGINNVATGQNDIVPPYRKIVRGLTTWYKQSMVVVQSLLPVNIDGVSNDAILAINRLLETIAREHGAEYLDVFRAFTDATGTPKSGYLSYDGVHLAIKGYDVWAREVERFLRGE